MLRIFYTSMLLITAASASEINIQEENKKSESSYMLATGASGKERLEIMEKVYGPFNQSLFNKLDLPNNPKILIVGCGTGLREIEMAQQFPNMHITATDSCKEQFALAEQRAEELGLPNLEFKEMNAKALSPKSHFDAVCARFLLMHVQNPDDTIAEMASTVKLGGLVVCEETSSSSFHCNPEDESHKKALEIVKEVGKIKGVDYDIGVKLKGKMTGLGLNILIDNRHGPDSSDQNVKELFFLTFKEAKPKLLALNFNEQELDKYLNGMKNWACNEKSRISMTDIFQVVGRRTK